MLLFLAGVGVGIFLVVGVSVLSEKRFEGKKGSERWQCARCLKTFLWENRGTKSIWYRSNGVDYRDCCPRCQHVGIEKV